VTLRKFLILKFKLLQFSPIRNLKKVIIIKINGYEFSYFFIFHFPKTRKKKMIMFVNQCQNINYYYSLIIRLYSIIYNSFITSSTLFLEMSTQNMTCLFIYLLYLSFDFSLFISFNYMIFEINV